MTLHQYSSAEFDSTFKRSNCRPTTREILISFPISAAITFASLKVLANQLIRQGGDTRVAIYNIYVRPL